MSFGLFVLYINRTIHDVLLCAFFRSAFCLWDSSTLFCHRSFLFTVVGYSFVWIYHILSILLQLGIRTVLLINVLACLYLEVYIRSGITGPWTMLMSSLSRCYKNGCIHFHSHQQQFCCSTISPTLGFFYLLILSIHLGALGSRGGFNSLFSEDQ